MEVLIKPLVTEKVTALNDRGVYGFVVDKKANKVEIKKAVEKAYNVNVESVNTLITSVKTKTRSSKRNFLSGRTSSIKKALVTLAKGEIIDFYSNI
jgi:large subunit ribosomal protein L23